MAREEVLPTPGRWIGCRRVSTRRANTHDQVDDVVAARRPGSRLKRPAASIRRLDATIARGRLTVDVGKQFIRWGKTDIVTPTDRFAPRDFLNVVDAEFLAVTGVRAVVANGANTLDAVWVPLFTPSRAPLLDQRWTAVPHDRTAVVLEDGRPRHLPEGSQAGVRWGHTTAAGLEFSASYFNGFNHLPDVTIVPGSTPTALAVVQTYPAIGCTAATWPRRRAGSPSKPKAPLDLQRFEWRWTDSVIYVVQLERQTGEWVIIRGICRRRSS